MNDNVLRVSFYMHTYIHT